MSSSALPRPMRPRRTTTGLASIGSAALLTLAFVSPAMADDDVASQAKSAIQTIAPSALDNVLNDPTSGADSGSIDVAGVTVTIPADPSTGVRIDSGAPVTIGLPFSDEVGDARAANGGFVAYDNGNASISVPVVHHDGSTQVLTVIDGPSAPISYAYPVSLPAGARLVAQAGGAIILDAHGETIGTFSAPWARDSAGRRVATHYSVTGNTLTQFVQHRADGVTYPVVADPTYYLSTLYYSRADVESMYKVIQNVNTFCKYVPLPYIYSVACGAPPSLESAITSAHYQKKRVKAVFHNCGFTYCNNYTYSVVS